MRAGRRARNGRGMRMCALAGWPAARDDAAAGAFCRGTRALRASQPGSPSAPLGHQLEVASRAPQNAPAPRFLFPAPAIISAQKGGPEPGRAWLSGSRLPGSSPQEAALRSTTDGGDGSVPPPPPPVRARSRLFIPTYAQDRACKGHSHFGLHTCVSTRAAQLRLYIESKYIYSHLFIVFFLMWHSNY